MSLLADETAGDLPVRDVGLMRGGLMPALPGLGILYSAPKSKKKSEIIIICFACNTQILCTT